MCCERRQLACISVTCVPAEQSQDASDAPTRSMTKPTSRSFSKRARKRLFSAHRRCCVKPPRTRLLTCAVARMHRVNGAECRDAKAESCAIGQQRNDESTGRAHPACERCLPMICPSDAWLAGQQHLPQPPYLHVHSNTSHQRLGRARAEVSRVMHGGPAACRSWSAAARRPPARPEAAAPPTH